MDVLKSARSPTATLNLLARAHALDCSDPAAIAELDQALIAAWDNGSLMARATCKALISRGEELPLLCRAQYHFILSDTEIYPGARVHHLREAHKAVHDPRLCEESSAIWLIENDEDFANLRQAIDDTLAAVTKAAADRKSNGQRTLAAASKAKNSDHLDLAYEVFEESRSEVDQDQREDKLRSAWSALEMHEKEVGEAATKDDSRLHTLRALIDAAADCLSLERSEPGNVHSLTRNQSPRRGAQEVSPEYPAAMTAHTSPRHSVSFLENPVSEIRVFEAATLDPPIVDELDILETPETKEANEVKCGPKVLSNENVEGSYGPWNHRPSLKERSPFRDTTAPSSKSEIIEQLLSLPPGSMTTTEMAKVPPSTSDTESILSVAIESVSLRPATARPCGGSEQPTVQPLVYDPLSQHGRHQSGSVRSKSNNSGIKTEKRGCRAVRRYIFSSLIAYDHYIHAMSPGNHGSD